MANGDNIDPKQQEEFNKKLLVRNKLEAHTQALLEEHIRNQEKSLKLSDAAVTFAENEVGMRNKAVSLVRQMNDLLQDEAISLEKLSKNQRNIRKDKEIEA